MTETPGRQGWLYVLPWALGTTGGVTQVVANMVRWTQDSLGHRPVVLVNDWAAPVPVRGPADHCVTYHARVNSPWPGFRRLRSLLAFPLRLRGQWLTLGKLLTDADVRVINIHFPDLSALSWILIARCHVLRPRVVLAFHGLDAKAAMQSGWIGRMLWKLTLQAADRVVGCSASVIADVRSIADLPEEAIQVLDNGVDGERIRRLATSALPRGLSGPYLLSLGTFEHKKGHDVLLTAFARVRKSFPGLSLVIAGRTGTPEAMGELEAIRRQVDAGTQVVFLRDLDHESAMALIGGAQLFVSASRVEPFGIAILEAAVLGCPVVATTACGVVHRLGVGAFAAVVPPGDPERLADAIVGVLGDIGRFKADAEFNAPATEGRFSWQHILQTWQMTMDKGIQKVGQAG